MPPQFLMSGPLVGRAADLTRLAALVGLDSDGAATSAVLLAGDAGVGKTRLLGELAKQADTAGWQVLVGHCLNVGDSALPYLPFSEIFGALMAQSPERTKALVAANPAVARLLPGRRLLTDRPLTDRLPSDRRSSKPERVDRAELLESVLAALVELGRTAPVLLVIEDAHWADPSTRELLGFLLARVPERISILASYRGDDLHRRHPLRASIAEWSRLPGVSRLQLGPLRDADMRSLVSALHPAALPAAGVRAIVERAEGNAFFAEELVAAVEAGNRTLPAELADLLLVRLDQLADPARLVVRAAAVAGRQVSHRLLARVIDMAGAALDRALRDAVETNVLVAVGADGYAFRHALLAEAVYDDLLPGERLRLHGAYVAALGSGDVPGTAAELARHARAAHDVPTAFRASVSAGDEAMALAGPLEAVHHYEVALELLPSARELAEVADEGLDEAELVVRASAAAAAAGDIFRAVALVSEQLARQPPDAPRRAMLLTALASAALLGDTGVDVLAVTAEVLALVPAEPPSPLRARAASLHARANADRYRDDAATRWAGEALALALALDLPEVTADASTTLGRLEERAGEPESSRRTLEHAVQSARAAGDVATELRTLFNVGALHYELGELAEARTAYEATAARARESGRPWAPYGVDGRVMSGVVAYVCGHWDDVTTIVDVSAESPPELAAAALGAVGLTVAAGRGKHQAIVTLGDLRPAWDLDGMVAVVSGGAAIDLYGDAEDIAAAIATHDDLVACVSKLWQNPLFAGRIRLSGVLLGQLCAHAGRVGTSERAGLARRGTDLAEVATAAADKALLARRHRGPESEAWLARVAAEHARLRWLTGVDPPAEDELVRSWRTSVDALARFGHVFEVARSRCRLAAVLHAAGEPKQAAEHARLAREAARRLGAAPLLAELEPLGPPRRVAPQRGGQPLTPRELEVLTLVAQGRSNRDIGRQLFISAKTVSVHVSAILAKLGAAGRTEAVVLAARHGLLGGPHGAHGRRR